MRILHIVHQYMPDKVGGTELYTQTIARYQLARGHETAVFTPANLPSDSSLLPDDEAGVRVYRAPVGERGRGRVFADTFYRPDLTRALQAVLARERPHLVHVQHLMGLPFALVDAVAAAGIPLIITLHDYWYGCANAQLITNDTQAICAGPDARYHNCARCALARAGQDDRAWLAPVVAPLLRHRNAGLRRIWQQAFAIIAPTRFVRDVYAHMGLPADPVVVIPHGIDVPQAHIADLLARRPPRQPGAPLHVGYVGSLGWQKGLHVLVTAVNQLPADQIRLSLYGSLDTFPDYVAQLRQQATHPGIRFMGRVSRDAVWAAMAEFDLFALPTLWYEASPLTIQEAFAVRLPIVGSRIGALPEKIRDGGDGLLFPPGDAGALRAILQRLAANPAELDALRAQIQPVRTIQEQLQDIDALYEQATTGRRISAIG